VVIGVKNEALQRKYDGRTASAIAAAAAGDATVARTFSSVLRSVITSR